MCTAYFWEPNKILPLGMSVKIFAVVIIEIKGKALPHGNSVTSILVLVLYCDRIGTIKSMP
jgi:hypothetical protein